MVDHNFILGDCRANFREETSETEQAAAIPRWKRFLDLACMAAAAPIWAPLMLLIVLVIKVVSPGPVLFRQERVGYRGRKFTLLKFRTMRVNASVAEHERHLARLIQAGVPMVKMDARGDRRIIPMGRLLRASGLDELPQLLNILRGDMSLVGPRPCLPFEYDRYLPSQKGRFQGLPGLTGLWQVSGKNRTTFAEMIQLDVDYLNRLSFGQDVKILARTIPALVVQFLESRKAPPHPPAKSAD